MNISKLTTYQAGASQARFNRKLQTLCDQILEPYGITKMQWLIIGTVLDEHETGIRLSELAERLGTSMPYLTTTINLLESKDILERESSTKDTRAKIIRVAKGYQRTCKKIEDALRDGLRKEIYAKIDPAEFRVYLKVMQQLAED